MNKVSRILLMTLGCLLIALPAMAQYTEFVVEPGGSGTTYPDLTSAVATAQGFTGDHRIVIRAGTYSDFGLVIDHSQPGKIREIVGDDKATVIFTDPTAQTDFFMDVSGVTDLSVSGISVVGYMWGMTSQVGPPTDLHVFDCIFDDNGVDGVASDKGGGFSLHGSDILIEDCEVMNGERGIRFGYKYWNATHANTWVGPVTAMDNITVQNCYVHDNDQYGIYYDGLNAPSMNGALVQGNVVENNADAAIQLWPQGATFNGPVVSGNTVDGAAWEGILVQGATGAQVFGNTVSGCSKSTVGGAGNTNLNPRGGIYLSGVNGGQVYNNTCFDNGDVSISGSSYGLWVTDAGTGVNIHDNCFYDHIGTEGYDGGTGADWWHANYYEVIDPADTNKQALYGYYVLDGSAGKQDNVPLKYDNSASGPATVDVWDNVTYDIDWTVPACAVGDELPLAAYQFTVTWDPAYFTYVDGDYDTTYLHDGGAGALYTPIGGDPGTGTLTFAATNFDEPGIGDGRLAWVELQAIKTGGPTPITVASFYRDPDNHDIPAGSTPLDVTIEDNEIPVVATFAVDDPIGNNTFGNLYGMTISGTCTDNYDLYYIWYKFDGAGGWQGIGSVDGTSDSFGPFALNMALVSGDGTHTLNLMVRDESANEGYFNYDFELDNTGPDVANLVLSDLDGCAQAGYSRTAEVAVAWDNPDGSTVSYEFWEVNNTGWQPAITGTSPTTYTFPSVEGSNGLYVRQYDVYGNLGAQIGPVNITLDWTASTPSNLALDGGAAKTGDVTVAVSSTWNVVGGSLQYILTEDKNDITCDAAGWQDIVVPYVYDFDLADVEGTHWVFRACKDIAGNVSAIDSASIVYDKTAPAITSVLIEDVTLPDLGGEDCTDTYAVQVTVTFTDDGDATKLELSNDGFTTTATYTGAPLVSPYVATYTMTGAPASDQMITIDAKLYDDVDNVGTGTDDIYLDFNAPTVTSIELQDAAATEAPVYGVQWTNDATVNVEISGAGPDVVELVLSEDNFVSHEVVVPVTAPISDPYILSYTYQGTPATCTYSNVWMKVRDCSGNESGVVSDGIVFDAMPPSIATFTGPAMTNSLTVALTLSASDDCSLQKMRFSEDDPTFTGAVWETYAASKSFVLEDKGAGMNDGPRTVYVQVCDAAGNIDTDNMSVNITVDMTLPTGSFVIVSINPLAAPGYTNNANVTFENIVADPDVVEMKFRNMPQPTTGSANTAFTPIAGSYSPWGLNTGWGTKTVEMQLKDGAGNKSAWIQATILMSGAVPPAPPMGTAFATPGHSADFCWGSVADAQKYILRYNFTNEYPLYPSGIAPHPLSWAQGIGLAQVMAPDTTFNWSGPQPDVYSVSIWVLNNYGVYSAEATPNVDIVTTNYRLGDYLQDNGDPGPDGCVAFDPEFVVLGISYLTSTGDAEFRDSLDIAPTSDASEVGYPIPDGDINFEDLVIFAKNYSWSRAQSACAPGGAKAPAGAALAIAETNISAEMPSYVRAGEEITVPLSISNPEAVMAYHFSFDYDHTMLELVSVDPGQAYASLEHSFFYLDEASKDIDLHSAVLGTQGFGDQQLATFTFRAISSGPVTLKDKLLDVRDWDLSRPEVAFSMSALTDGLPNSFAMSQNYPNPFNPTTAIELSLAAPSRYKLTIYNVLGQEVKTFEGFADRGYTTINWDASEQASGIYLYKVQAGTFTATRKMVLLK